MANNPYSPPRAEVTEHLAAPAGAVLRPRTVVIGLGIITALLIYGAVNISLGMRLQRFNQSPLLVAAALLPLAGLLSQAAAIVFAFRRRNWARITLLVLLALGFLGIAVSLFAFSKIAQAGSFPRYAAVLSGLLLLRTAGVGLLFTPSANAWFRSRTN